MPVAVGGGWRPGAPGRGPDVYRAQLSAAHAFISIWKNGE